jgi:sortase B signal domain, QVPTGV class subfamily
MKLKKFFAGVLAAAMMLTVGATAAFATEGNNTPNDVRNSFPDMTTIDLNSELELTKNYKVENGKAPFEKFEFDVTYVGAVKKDTNVTGEPASNWSITKEADFTKDTAGVPTGATGLPASGTAYKENFKIKLNELNIPTGGTGIYVYKITEKDNGTPAVSYNTDGGRLYLIVTVTHVTDGNGNIQDDLYNYAVALRRGDDNITAANAAKGTKVLATEAFHNTYGAGNSVNSVELKKTVHGNFGDLGKDFTFNVTFNKAVDKNYGNIAFEAENGRKVYKANDPTQTGVNELEYGVEYVVTLKHGETIEFGNLPADVTYTMVENGKQDVEGTQKVDGIYTVTGEKTEDNKGTVTASATTAKEEIVNTNQESPDMGVVLDNAPYIAMLAIVAIGGVALMLNKRRRDEE